MPPDDLLEQFHQIVKPMFEFIDENNTENQALTRTQDTILPRLMSGELDVSDIDLYTNILTTIIDLMDGAKYLWGRDRHEQ